MGTTGTGGPNSGTGFNGGGGMESVRSLKLIGPKQEVLAALEKQTTAQQTIIQQLQADHAALQTLQQQQMGRLLGEQAGAVGQAHK